MIDKNALNDYQVVKEDNAKVSLAKAIDSYLMSAEDLIGIMQDSLSEDDGGIFEHAAHILKTSSAAVGACEVSALAGDLERLSRHARLSSLSPIMRQVHGEFTKASAELQNIRQTLN